MSWPFSMEKSRPQLSLAELFQLRWFLGGALGLLSGWTLFYMEVDAILALALLTLAVPVFTFWPHLSRLLPGFFHRLAFPLIVTIFALDLWANREPLPAMIRLDLLLLGYRCVSPRGRREDLQLILLALFVVVVTGVYTVSPAFVVQILFFTGAALALLLTVTLSDARAGGAASADAAPGWERVRWRELFGRVRAVTDLRVAALGCALFAGVVACSVVLFLALPRVEISNDFFLDRLITKKSRTGFSENITFGEVVDIAEDHGMAFAVDVSDPAMVPAEPYWRMLVLDEYSGDGFRMSAGLTANFSAREKAQLHNGFGSSDDGGRTTWTIFYQPGVSRYLPLMGGFRRIGFNEPQPLRLSSALRLAALQTEPAKMIPYRVEGMDTDGILRDRRFAVEREVRPAGRRFGWPRMRDENWADAPPAPLLPPDNPPPDDPSTDDSTTDDGSEPPPRNAPAVASGDGPRRSAEEDPENNAPPAPTFLEIGRVRPEDKARLDAWVAEIGGAGEGGADFARRAGAWLQSRHSYSMRSRTPAGDGDVLIRWMASTEPGHCELFAGSLVLLARAAGVPARLVTGFKGGVWNETSGHISVKNSDAHAWTEIWEESLGSWLRSDATPGARLTPSLNAEDQPAGGVSLMGRDEGWGARIDGLRVFWYRRIVSFDQNSQIELLRGTKDRIEKTMAAAAKGFEERIREIGEWVRQPWDFSRVAGIALTVGICSGLAAWWRARGQAWWMGWRSRRSASHGHDPVRREAGRWLQRLARDEAERGDWSAADPVRGRLLAVRADLLRLRYGARESWTAPAKVFRRARRAHREARAARA